MAKKKKNIDYNINNQIRYSEKELGIFRFLK